MGSVRLRDLIKSNLEVLRIALRNLVIPERITVLYPFEDIDYGEMTRGWIRLNIRKCTSCMSCARICPANAIRMYLAPNGRRYPGIDYGKCILCYMCVDVCPEAALERTEIKDLAWYDPREALYTPEKEVEPPSVPKLAPTVVKVMYAYSNGRVIKVRVGEGSGELRRE